MSMKKNITVSHYSMVIFFCRINRLKCMAFILLWSIVFTCLLPFPTIAATRKGVEFKDEITVDNNVLFLHGIGLLKWKYLVDVYLVGLYKLEKVPLQKIGENVPKRLEYYFFVDMKASDFQETGFELMARNVGVGKAEMLKKELEEFNILYRDVKAGQRYTISFMPGKGLEMALDGKVLGVVQGDEFGSAYLSIWLGPNPVSKSLQEGMFDSSTKKR